MKLTIGMATYDDYDGVYFTIQSLRLHALAALRSIIQPKDVEILVVDNHPQGPEGPHIRRLMEDWAGPFNLRYIPFVEARGTTQSRQRIFDEARGEIVLCMDSHVLLGAASLRRLIEFFDKTKDKVLVSGPLLDDALNIMATHFDPVWRSEMLGIWSTALFHPELSEKHGLICARETDDGHAKLHEVLTGKLIPFDTIVWSGHDKVLRSRGFEVAVASLPFFEIPAMGLGVFACRKEDWPGFNPHFRGFGGEECYIHEKFRRAGGKCICLRDLVWIHRFGRVHGTPYELSVEDKVRNYVLGHQELGLDLEPVRQHFANRVSPQLWRALVEDAVNVITPSMKPPKNKGATKVETSPDGRQPQPPRGHSLDEMFEWVKSRKRDLNQHADTLKALATKCPRIVEFTKRRESSIMFLAGRPQSMFSVQHEQDPILAQAQVQVIKEKKTSWRQGLGDSLTFVPLGSEEAKKAGVGEADLLFIDSQHTADRIYKELSRHGKGVTRFIALHDTKLYGKKGEDGGPGLLVGLKRFMDENPEWFVVFHTPAQYGLTVIGRQEQDRPTEEVLIFDPGKGPGTELKKLLSQLGIEAKEDCECNKHAIKMDINGPDWCEQNVESIVGWMEGEWHKQQARNAQLRAKGMPVEEQGSYLVRTIGFRRFLARRLVRKAIANARKQENQ